MYVTANRNFGRFGAYLFVAPFQATILGFYGNMVMPKGIVGAMAGGLCGLLWALLTGVIAHRLMRQRTVLWANAPLFLAIIVVGLMTGPSLMYGWMMTAALNEPSTTYAVLSALMWPAVPFYITLNSAMELALVSLLVFWNWEADRRRRVLILVGVTIYFAMRVWTYHVFAEARLDIARHTLSQVDVEWFKQTLATDFRPVLNVITFICLILAALVPPWPASGRLSTTTNAKQVALHSR